MWLGIEFVRMGDVIPDDWHRLGGWQRDVLVTLAVQGPQSVSEVSAAIDGEVRDSTASQALSKVRDKGYVETKKSETNAYATENRLTTEGLALVYEAVVKPAITIDQNG